jgi:phosphoribosyl-AMP cyclohydrolase
VHSVSKKKHSSARWRNKPQRDFCFGDHFQKSGGLVPAIIQDERTGDVLMLGFMNPESLAQTKRTGEVVFFSRSRNRLWKKGESSGHVLRVREMRVDCDADALLVRVEAVGPGVCHEGYRSCFFRKLEPDGSAAIIAERTFTPEKVYGQEKTR